MYNVLIVDDEFLLRQLINRSVDWAAIGLKVAGEAESGEEAIHRVTQGGIDIVLMDINLPYMNGIEASEKIHSLCPEIAIIILTGYGEFSYAKSAIAIGVIDYLLKPINDEELRATLLRAKEARRTKKRLKNLPTTDTDEGQKEAFIPSKTIREAVAHIDANFGEKTLSLATISAELHVNASYLSALFKDVMGINLGKYILEKRLKAALTMFSANPDASLAEVAQQVGFSDPYYFSRCFKKHFGKSPAHYIKTLG